MECNLDAVHRMIIPGLWSRIKMETFPETWVVLGLEEGSTTHWKVARAGGGPGSGLRDVVRHLPSDRAQFCGFRVGFADGSPGEWVHLCWIGEAASDETRAHALAHVAFMEKYFSDARAVLMYDATEATALKALLAMCDIAGDDGAAERRRVIEREVADLIAPELGFSVGSDALDFGNHDITSECVHYEGSMGEEAEEEGSKLDDIPPGVDALAHALAKLQRERAATASEAEAVPLPPTPPLVAVDEGGEERLTQERLLSQRATLEMSRLLISAAKEQAAKRSSVDEDRQAHEEKLRRRREALRAKRHAASAKHKAGDGAAAATK
jgi:hypothetical protein